jgi:hypothetical protein
MLWGTTAAGAAADPSMHGDTRWLAASALWIECRGCDPANAEAAARELPVPVTVIYFDPVQRVSHAYELRIDPTTSVSQASRDGVTSPTEAPEGSIRCEGRCRVTPAAMNPEQLRFRSALIAWYASQPVGWNKSFEVRAEAIGADEWPGSLRHLGALSAADVAGNQSAKSMLRRRAGEYLRRLGPLELFEALSRGALATPSRWKMDLVVRFADGSAGTLEYGDGLLDGRFVVRGE